MGKPKRINFELIQPEPETEPYRLMREIRARFHEDIRTAKIALAWRKALQPDPDGHLVLGRCMKASDLQRELVKWDFVILLNQEVWSDPEFTKAQKEALLDHELCHADRACDKEGEPKIDERGRAVWRTRKHDIEEFQAIVTRHGCYKRDLEIFAEALLKKRTPPLPFEASEVLANAMRSTSGNSDLRA